MEFEDIKKDIKFCMEPDTNLWVAIGGDGLVAQGKTKEIAAENLRKTRWTQEFLDSLKDGI